MKDDDVELAQTESLLDIVDHLLTKGVVISGDLVIGVADVDLIYLRVSAVLCAADRVLPNARPRRKKASRSLANVAGIPKKKR